MQNPTCEVIKTFFSLYYTTVVNPYIHAIFRV